MGGLITFVTQHEGNRQETELAPRPTFDGRIDALESMDEHESQEDHVLRDLGR